MVSTVQAYRRLIWASSAVMVLTMIHHGYGAWRYADPWRHHIIPVAIIVVVVMVWLYRHIDHRWARIGLVVISAALPIAWIGVFEGGYNHLLKLIVFAADSEKLYPQLFSAGIYERPDDWFFELSGVAQLIPALAAVVALARIAKHGRRFADG